MNEGSNALKLPAFSRPPDAIALDIDGTLLDSQSHLSARNARALKDCIGQGIPVIIATSRPQRAVRRLLGMEIMNTCSLVMQNGAIGIANPPLSGRIKQTIPLRLVKEVLQASLKLEPGLRFTVELGGEAFGTNRPRDPVSLWEHNSATPEMQLTMEEALTQDPTKIAMGGLERDITHLADMILKRFGGDLSVVGEAGKTFFNITNKNARKSNTLRELLHSQNISLENTVAIGDDLPDHDMLSSCGIDIAMGNAVPEIKAICPYVTATNNEDGVALVLEKILSAQSR